MVWNRPWLFIYLAYRFDDNNDILCIDGLAWTREINIEKCGESVRKLIVAA